MGKLFIVPTPIGNMEDMTLRAINVLKECELVLAEDTRTSGFLLKHFGIETIMQSHHKFNEHQTLQQIIQRLRGGANIALISDAIAFFYEFIGLSFHQKTKVIIIWKVR
jgi:16S rRNA (cytidine1402-2'-O)-methyltransferase